MFTSTARVRAPARLRGCPTDQGPRPEPLPPVRPALATWHRFSSAAPSGEDLSTDAAVYGADIPTEAQLKLLGTLEGKRVLDLGCGAGHASVAFARQGAKVIAVDPSNAQLDRAREAADAAEVKVELQQAELADLAFVRADAIDVAFSAFALAEVVDLDRVFRQVHRVLKPECPLVFSLPHPAFSMFSPTAEPPLAVHRRYHDPSLVTWYHGDDEVIDHPRTVSVGLHQPHPRQLPGRRDPRTRGARRGPAQPQLGRPHAVRPGHDHLPGPQARDLMAGAGSSGHSRPQGPAFERGDRGSSPSTEAGRG